MRRGKGSTDSVGNVQESMERRGVATGMEGGADSADSEKRRGNKGRGLQGSDTDAIAV